MNSETSAPSGDIKTLWVKKKILYFLSRIILLYLIILIFLFFNQKNMLYFPDKTDFNKCVFFNEEEKITKDTLRYYFRKWENNNLIIFFHWNAGRACDRIWVLSFLEKTNSSIIIVEYPWYAETTRNPSMKKIKKEVNILGKSLNLEKYDKISLMGISLWAWPASYFAWKFEVDRLLLISPYDKLYRVAQSKFPIFPIKYLFTEHFNPINYLYDFQNPILIIHWKQDKVIPHKHWLNLYNSLVSDYKKMISLEKANHHNIFSQEAVREKIVNFFSY